MALLKANKDEIIEGDSGGNNLAAAGAPQPVAPQDARGRCAIQRAMLVEVTKQMMDLSDLLGW